MGIGMRKITFIIMHVVLSAQGLSECARQLRGSYAASEPNPQFFHIWILAPQWQSRPAARCFLSTPKPRNWFIAQAQFAFKLYDQWFKSHQYRKGFGPW